MIQFIPPHLWHTLDFSEFGETPKAGEIFAYVEDGVTKGWYMVENRQVHVGPFVVYPEFRGNGIASAMAQDAKDSLPAGYYVAARTEQTKQMCRKHGMTEIEGTLFVMEK